MASIERSSVRKISPSSFDRLETLISEAVSQGARLLAGGKRYHHPKYPQGHYFQPTLLVDVEPSMRIAQDEVFAPIALLMRADSPEDAIRKANSTPYGLGSSVFASTSTAADRAIIEKCVSQIKSGMVAVNDFACYYAVQLPFGGVKGSGYGKFAGEEGLRGLCNIKSVCEDRFSSIARTAIPGDLDYPMNRKRGPEAGKGVVELGYGELWRKATGLRRILGI
ncbi:Aldehyde/histidinol dehydrogenase [Elsinoe ampelina]|uniref:aldehyde dehydrogenase (NAD(+)) n=1 Tax=Elsinoe ampelina TaxID=302913 RepID=A0A6A6GN72_9PEZI|nr:Aldehyde/histidinol dehydrogenase [Elsinoe ampelina]